MNTNIKPMPKIFEQLELLAAIVPAPFYWTDKHCVIVGINRIATNLVRDDALHDNLIGKRAYDIYDYESAQIVENHIYLVMQEKRTLVFEESLVDIIDGKFRTYVCTRAPLIEDNQVVGVVGTLSEITDFRENARLLIDAQNKQIEQQLEFRKIAAQVAHDIGSPLASLKMVIPHCTTLPENTRSALNKAAGRISDIAENFLSQFRPKQDDNLAEAHRIPTLIMAEILEILTEKKYQYNKLSIDFTTTISQAGAFAFINVDIVSFKRMLSNLINNAVDALEGKIGEVTIGLDEIDNQVLITVTDNGKGMPEDVKNKILANVEVTAGKTEGHGIGFMQIRETLHNNEGKFDIESRIGVGTRVKLFFPTADTPNWMANSIELNNDDQIIILDDDDSIHTAWELRFNKAVPHIKRHHFKQGGEAIEFINSIRVECRDKIFLLTDYELLKQGLHGLEVIEKTGINRSILVTSHHNNQLVRDKAMLTNTKILPKLLASEVNIKYI